MRLRLYTYINSFNVENVFIRLNLTYKTASALKGLKRANVNNELYISDINNIGLLISH